MKNTFIAFVTFCVLLSCSSNNESSEEKILPKNNIAIKDTAKITAPEVIFESGLSTKFQNYEAEKCFTLEESEIYSTDQIDEFCAKRSVKFLTVTTNNLSTSETINKTIFKAVTGERPGSVSINTWVNQIKNTSDIYEALMEDINCSIIEQTNRLLVVNVVSDSYAYGAVHGSVNMQILNFNLETGEIVKLSDVMLPGYENALKKIAEKRFITENGKENWFFTPGEGDFKLAKNYAFTKKGIEFSYNQYEIGSYSSGVPSITVSYKTISHLLADTKLLEGFIQPNDN
jgi:hypothetical protein